MAQTVKFTFGDFNVQEMVQVYRGCREAVTFMFRGSDNMEELGFGLEQCPEGQEDNGGIPLLKDVDVSKVASSSKLNAQAPVFKPPRQVLASILPGTPGPAQPSEGTKSTTASPSTSSETTMSSADTARHVVLETPRIADDQTPEGHSVFKGGQSSQLGFQNLDPSIVTFVWESSIASGQSDGIQQTTLQSHSNDSIEFLYELGACSRSNSLSKDSTKSSQAPSEVHPSSSTLSDGGSTADGQQVPGSSSPSPTGGTKTPPLHTDGTKTPPLPTGGTKMPPLPTGGTKTPPSPTGGTKTPPLPTVGTKTPPSPTGGTKTPPSPTGGAKTSLPSNGTKPLPTSTNGMKPSSTVSGVNPQGVIDHAAAGGRPPSAADSSSKPPPPAPPVAASAWSRPKDWGTVFGSGSTVGGGGPRFMQKPSESTSPPESGIADMHEGIEDRSSEASNPLLVQLGEKLKSLPVSYSEEVRLVPRGLVNAANLCYMHCHSDPSNAPGLSPSGQPPAVLEPGPASFLRALPHSDAGLVRFAHEFESADEYHEGGKRKRKSRSPQDFPKGAPIRPDYMYQVLDKTKSSLSRTVRGRQEDAQEFLGLVLDSLHEEMVAALSTVTRGPTPSHDKSSSLEDHPDDSIEEGEELGEGEEWEQVGWNNKSMVTRQTSHSDSPIAQVFGGELLSIVQKQGSKESATVELFFALPVDIQDESVVTVQHALERLGTKEVLHDMYCSKTNTEVEASRKMTLSRLPPVLLLHLKQFSFTSKGSQKLNKPIEYSMELEIPRDLLAPPIRKKVTVEQRKYHLSGVVYHHGLNAAGGHYTSDVRLAQCGGWFNANDTHLKPLSEEQVLKGQSKELNKVAYLLCYQRSSE